MLFRLKYKKIFLLVTLVLFGIGWGFSVQAGTLSWQQVKNDDFQNVTFVLRLTTDNKRENAWSGQIDFDSDQLKLQTISDARSFISPWLERPTEKVPGQISFSGISPGGFAGSGEIFRLVFTKTSVSYSNYPRVTNFESFLGDGSGQKAKVIVSSTPTLIEEDSVLDNPLSDHVAPELFWQLVREDLVTSNWQLITSASDKQSGIKYLAIATTNDYLNFWTKSRTLNSSLNWQKLDGLKILSPNDLNHLLFIKAVDNAGNVKLIKLYPVITYYFVLICLIIIVLILFLFL